MNLRVVLLIAPLSISQISQPVENKKQQPYRTGYHIKIDEFKRGYLVRVINSTSGSIRCTLKDGKHVERLIVRAYRTSEGYYFDHIPTLQCKAR